MFARILWTTLATSLLGGASFGLVLAELRRPELPAPWPEIEPTPRFEAANRLFDTQLEAALRASRRWRDAPDAGALREEIWEVLGPMDLRTAVRREPSAPPDAPRQQLRVELRAASGASLSLGATVWLPERTPAPAVLVLHGMGSRVEDLSRDLDYHHGIAGALVRAGFLVVAAERLATGYDERYVLAVKAELLGTTLEALEMQQLRALVRSVRAHPAFGGRLGVYGLSLGGYHALLLGALEPRVDAVFASAAVTDRFGLLLKRHPTPVTPAGERFARSFWYGDLPLYLEDMGPLLDDLNLVAALAPRPLALETGSRDALKLAGLEAVEQGARGIYRERGADEALRILRHEGGHEADVEAAVGWLAEVLPEPAAGATPP